MKKLIFRTALLALVTAAIRRFKSSGTTGSGQLVDPWPAVTPKA